MLGYLKFIFISTDNLDIFISTVESIILNVYDGKPIRFKPAATNLTDFQTMN